MLARPMISRHNYNCLSRNIPYPGVHKVYPSRTILILDFQSSKNISPLWLLLSWMLYHILKEYECHMLTQSSMLSSQSEDKNDMSISASQLGMIYTLLWRNVPIPTKEMFPSSLSSWDLSKLPLNQGLASKLPLNQGLVSSSSYLFFGGDHGTYSCL